MVQGSNPCAGTSDRDMDRGSARSTAATASIRWLSGRSIRLSLISDAYLELLDRFAAAHPHSEPHYYLSLLGTHPDHRGKGIGMQLLAHDLALIDDEHLPAYLESSNLANNQRYARVGFEPIGEFSYPGNGPVVTTMWRPAR
jgi:GNAT superfamily N-acetyltransferase